MKIKSPVILLICIFFLFSCSQMKPMHEVKHVVLIGLDGMGAYGYQRAATPYMNNMAQNGALSIKARCVLESSSSQNWMSMLTGAIPIQHGVTSNDWEPDNYSIDPSIKNKIGLYPSIFDNIKTQKPESKAYMFYEWDGLGRMFDLSVPDKVIHIKNGVELINEAFKSFFTDKPEFLFIAVDETDHAGHAYGHESQSYFDCISKYDSLIGKFTTRLDEENLLENTVVIITGDHGGFHRSHGGDTPSQMEIPILLYGGDVTKGKIIDQVNIISDIAPTVAGLLGITMPEDCTGKFISSAFEPNTGIRYAPIPVINPQPGLYKNSVEVSLRADSPEARIFYTLDNSQPTNSSFAYEKPIQLSNTATVKAVSIVGPTMSRTEQTSFRIVDENFRPAVQYDLFYNYYGTKVPDFGKMGNPAQHGLTYELSLEGLNLEDKQHFAVRMASTLLIEETGEYIFSLSSDDGSKLYINESLIADNDGTHGIETRTAGKYLESGEYKIITEYFNDSGSGFLEVSYKSPLTEKCVIPCNKLK